MSARGSPPQQPSEIAAPRTPAKEVIRSRMKMVIDQLEAILQELKEVAKELKEVVKQIDRLTSDFDFELEPDDWTIATMSSTSSSDTARNQDKCGTPSECGRPLGFLTPDILSDSWEFCSFLEPPGGEARRGEEPDYRVMNGGLVPNGPEDCAPDSSSEEAGAVGSAASHRALPRTSGTRERVRFSDKVLYHALCCDDDDDDDGEEEQREEEEEEEEQTPNAGTASDTRESAAPKAPSAPPSSSSTVPRHQHCPQPPVRVHPPARKKVMRNNSTQTVSHKSTQTLLSYGSSKKEDTK